MSVFRIVMLSAVLTIVLLTLLVLAGCANPVPAKTFGSMLGAQPACLLFCRVEQHIVADSDQPPTDASTLVQTMDGPAVYSK